MNGTMEMVQGLTLDAMVVAVAYKRDLKARMFLKMDVAPLGTAAVRLVVQLEEAGGKAWLADLVNPVPSPLARQELVQIGWLRCEVRERPGNGTHPSGVWMEFTARGKRQAAKAVAVLKRVREKVASDQCAVISGKAEEFQNH